MVKKSTTSNTENHSRHRLGAEQRPRRLSSEQKRAKKDVDVAGSTLARSASTTAAVPTEEKRKQFVVAIRSKKGLETLDDAFVAARIEKIFAANHKLKAKFDASTTFAQFSRSKEYEELLKRIRKELRAIYGVFQQSDRGELLVALRKARSEDEKKEILTTILASHTSTKERLPHYDTIYQELARRITPAPRTIIDLGCGMNPLAYDRFVAHGWKPSIVASDISATDMQFLRDAFAALHIPGSAVTLDLTKDYKLLSAMKGDVTLLLKLLDSLEETHRHISYKLFDHITTPWIVASFPTQSLGGKKHIARAGRTWFERLLARKGLAYETFSVENELFYVVRNTDVCE